MMAEIGQFLIILAIIIAAFSLPLKPIRKRGLIMAGAYLICACALILVGGYHL